MSMDPQLKQRIVGAAVLVALAVVFIPILLDETGEQVEAPAAMEIEVIDPESFNSRVVPLNDDDMAELVGNIDATPEELSRTQDWDDDPDSKPPRIVSPEGEAETPVVAPETRTGVTAWVVQLGSFESEKNANGLVEKLRKDNYTAFIEPLNDGDKISYRVRVGPELTKVVADGIQKKLKADTDIDGIVMRYP